VLTATLPRLTRFTMPQQAVRVVRSYAKEWGIDPNRIGVMGFSAGAELAAPAAVLTKTGTRKTMIPPTRSPHFLAPRLRRYHLPRQRPSPATAPHRPFPKDIPPAFLVCASGGDRVHAILALEYYQAMLMAGVPN